jgi:hypothetical protein
MKLEPGKFCPLIGKDCIGLECSWFTQVRGYNPNTGNDIDEWGCAINWLPLLIIENSQQQRQTVATVQEFRNESTKSSENQNLLLKLLAQNLVSQNQIRPANIQIEENKEQTMLDAQITSSKEVRDL